MYKDLDKAYNRITAVGMKHFQSVGWKSILRIKLRRWIAIRLELDPK
jgi:hypothetical protein